MFQFWRRLVKPLNPFHPAYASGFRRVPELAGFARYVNFGVE
jgi:hypothetical protein